MLSLTSAKDSREKCVISERPSPSPSFFKETVFSFMQKQATPCQVPDRLVDELSWQIARGAVQTAFKLCPRLMPRCWPRLFLNP